MTENKLNNQKINDKLSVKLLISGINQETSNFTLPLQCMAYRAEGNANLVLSLINRKEILRLRKTMVKKDQTEPDDEIARLQELCKYLRSFMLLLNPEFNIIPQIVELEINDYDAFNTWLLPFRPGERMDKVIRCRYGLLYPDVAYMPDRLLLMKNNEQAYMDMDTYSIEIKPKQGWTLFTCDPKMFALIDLNGIDKCRYCAKQYLKMQNGVVQKISGYCPIDLFSGYPKRMSKAINGIIETPQNNFRLCKNGQIIFDNTAETSSIISIIKDIFKGTSDKLHDFIDLLIRILTKEFTEVQSSTDNFNETEMNINDQSCSEPSTNCLPTKCILKQILDIQLLLKSNNWSMHDFEQTNSNSYLEYIDNLFIKAGTETNSMRPLKEIFLEKLSKKERYLLGATALDCSILLTFQRISDTDTNSFNDNAKRHIVKIGHHNFLSNASVVDLDPKTEKHFEKFVNGTNKSHNAYRKYLKNVRKL